MAGTFNNALLERVSFSRHQEGTTRFRSHDMVMRSAQLRSDSFVWDACKMNQSVSLLFVIHQRYATASQESQGCLRSSNVRSSTFGFRSLVLFTTLKEQDGRLSFIRLVPLSLSLSHLLPTIFSKESCPCWVVGSCPWFPLRSGSLPPIIACGFRTFHHVVPVRSLQWKIGEYCLLSEHWTELVTPTDRRASEYRYRCNFGW